MKVLTNFVPAVAVKRKEQVLSVVTGRKGRVGGLLFEQSEMFLKMGRKVFVNRNDYSLYQDSNISREKGQIY